MEGRTEPLIYNTRIQCFTDIKFLESRLRLQQIT